MENFLGGLGLQELLLGGLGILVVLLTLKKLFKLAVTIAIVIALVHFGLPIAQSVMLH